ncbi:MAG: hypothetical protein ABIL02_04385 [candidate division WOR-3 bacterium]
MNEDILTKSVRVVIFLVTFLFGSLLFFINHINGPGYWPDSISYISASEHLLSGKGFVQYDGTPFVAWPPLFPVLLAFIKLLTNFDYKLITNIVNILSFITTIYVSSMLLSKLIKPRFLVYFFMLFVIVSLSLIGVSQWAGTEILFISLTMLFFYSLYHYFAQGKTYVLIIMAIIAMLCNLLRYPAIILTFAGFFIILFGHGLNNWRRHFKKAIIFGLISCLPIIFWSMRNYFLTETFFGLRGTSRYSVSTNIKLTLFTIYMLFYPVLRPFITTMIIALSSLLITIILFYILTKKHIFLTHVKAIFNQEFVKTKLVVALFGYTIFYLSFIIFISSIKAHDEIGNRLLAPIFIPLTIIAFYICGRVSKYILHSVIINTLVVSLFGLSFVSNIYASFKSIKRQIKFGLGYNSISISKSEMINFLRTNFNSLVSNDTYILSNDPHLVYYATKEETQWAPLKRMYNSADTLNNLSKIRDNLAKRIPFFLIWFYAKEKSRSHWIFSLNELSSTFKLDTLNYFSDGLILKCTGIF